MLIIPRQIFSPLTLRKIVQQMEVSATNGNLILVKCIMNNNTVHGNGGVGYLEENSDSNVKTSVFRANSALNAGGVLWARKGIVIIKNSSIAFNEAGVSGGVIEAQSSSVINISHTTCLRNKVEGAMGRVFNVIGNTKVLVNNSKILNNIAGGSSIMSIDGNSVLEICHSQINRNYAFIGAVCIHNNSLAIALNSSLMDNTGFMAGSIHIMDSITYLENCTFRGNQATVAGAIAIWSSNLKLSNTLFLDNKGPEGNDIYCLTTESKLINKIHTYRSKFTHGNVTVRSNGTRVFQVA